MKKIIASSVLTTAVLFPVLVNAEELKLPTSMKVEQKVDLRKGATSSYPIVKSLTSGQSVKIIDDFTNSFGEVWYRVDLGTEKGWALSTAFKKIALPPSPVTGTTDLPVIGSTVYSQINGLEVRRGAMLTYAAVSTLKINQEMKVLDLFAHNSGELWVRVQLSSGLMGWVPAPMISSTAAINKTLYVKENNTNLRSGPSTEYSIIETAVKGTVLTAISLEIDTSGGKWYKAAKKDGSIVWIHESVVSDLPITNITTKYVGTKNAQLFSGASYSYKVKKVLPYYSKVSVLGQFINSGQTWMRVKTSDGLTGWTPEYELISSKSDLENVYALNKAVVRRGASTAYTVLSYLKENESIVVLREVNGWLNVETSGGTRGWIDKKFTSPTSLKRLISPVAEIRNGDQYLTWKKPIDYSFKYTELSYNRLKLYGGLTDIELPTVKIPGIQNIETISSGTEKSVIITFEPGYTYTIRDNQYSASIKVMETGLNGKKIMIDAGHGGKDTGAIGPTGLREKDVNLGTALLLKTELEKYGAKVSLTRGTDIFLELSERTTLANKSDYDSFISLHSDSFSTSSAGSTMYYNATVNFNGPNSKEMGEIIHKNLIPSIGTYNRGVKEQTFYVNRMNELPSVLIELAYISNPKEEALLRSNTFRQKAAIGVRKGLEEYFNNF